MAKDNKAKDEEFKHMVRIARKDVDGNKSIENALADIKGVGRALSMAICKAAGFNAERQIGLLSDEEVLKVEEAVKNPQKYDIPSWMLNRRNDYETGKTFHLIEADLSMSLRDDLNRMKKIRSYKGKRHEVGLPVRGQKTKATFRKGSSVGVRRRRGKPMQEK
jgi:small subunit ribosomal protein S13